jgi:2-polyprenyl-3-methyl-5-hydroxy-6-metoxy-1,4-benzoquinol methylase
MDSAAPINREAGSDAGPRWPATPGAGADAFLRESFRLLRAKWSEAPAGGSTRVRTGDLLRLPDETLVERWSEFYRSSSTGPEGFVRRGWRQLLYRDTLRGKKVMDIGCGLAFDTLVFAGHGANVTFVDVVGSNVEVVRRLCRLKGLAGHEFCYMEDLRVLDRLPDNYDVIYCCGSLTNAPTEVIRLEAQALVRHLPPGGRWMELAYPESRWEREGRMPFDQWGAKTDGGAPWMEWRDLEKIQACLAPAKFETVLALEFDEGNFNWFDLLRTA